jgi:hypothetical protein
MKASKTRHVPETPIFHVLPKTYNVRFQALKSSRSGGYFSIGVVPLHVHSQPREFSTQKKWSRQFGDGACACRRRAALFDFLSHSSFLKSSVQLSPAQDSAWTTLSSHDMFSLKTLFRVLIGLVFPSPLPCVSRLAFPFVCPLPSPSGRGLTDLKLGASF